MTKRQKLLRWFLRSPLRSGCSKLPLLKHLMTLRPIQFAHGLRLSGRHRHWWQHGLDQFEHGLLRFAWRQQMSKRHLQKMKSLLFARL
jgi:hypothetical protein